MSERNGVAPAQPITLLPVSKLGMYGTLFDPPEAKRAYTYRDQPGNAPAMKLGRAALAAVDLPAGDLIDRGLSLLRALADEGFGVFQIESEVTK